MYKVKLVLSYDGTEFGGWQKQKLGKPTIQGALEDALMELFKKPVKTVGSGRTDAGVHAAKQVCHFEVNDDPKRFNLTRSLNTLTPDGISIREAYLAPEDFHALHSATEKTYKYIIHSSPTPNALRSRYSHWVRHDLNLNLLNAYSEKLLGEKDFKSFQTSGTDVKTTVRSIFEAKWAKADHELFAFTISGSGFLKQMVRNIVGTQLDLHAKESEAEEFEKIIEAHDRRQALGTAPAQGLYLEKVEYPKSISSQCTPI